MGLFRFLLAAGVVLGHARGWGSFTPSGFIGPYQAVQGFFILSGFYMSLTYPTYDKAWQFYVSRMSRLLPLYWIAAATTVCLWHLFPYHPLSEPYLRNFHEATGLWAILIFIPNFLLIGSDSFIYFPQTPSWPQYWTIPQQWSLGTEIWFYLLVPLLVPARTGTLVMLILAGVLLRFAFIAHGLPFFPWQQNVFPAELSFFLVGILAHRVYEMRAFTAKEGWAAFAFGVVFLSAGNKLHLFPNPYEESLYNSLVVAIVLFLIIPASFHLTKKSPADKLIGEFAYPIYLWHITIGYYYEPAQRLWHGWYLLLLCILLSIPLVYFIELPLERLRARLKKARYNISKSPSSLMLDKT